MEWNLKNTLAYIAANTTTDENCCQIWTGSTTKDGYGQIGIKTLQEAWGIKLVHRLVYHLHTGHVFEKNEQVRHSCDKPSCITPSCLSGGTAFDNAQDAKARGRTLAGERHKMAKLTNDQVRAIKRLIEYGWKNNYIQQRLGYVSSSTISGIRSGRAWKSVTI